MAETTVTTFAQLKKAVEDAETTQIRLGNDISFSAGGINIPKFKGALVIDGAGFSITDYPSAAAGDTLGVTGSGSALSVTIKNIVWNGRNYYGAVYVPSASAYGDVTVLMDNITYTGPEFIYNRYGISRLKDCTVHIQKNGSPGNAEELGEVNRIFIEGTVKVDSQTSATAALWFPYAGSALTVEENAVFELSAPNTYLWYTDSAARPQLTLKKNSSVFITAQRLFYDASTGAHLLASVTLESGAAFEARQSTNSGVPMLKCLNALTLNEGSSLTLVSPIAGASPLIYFINTAAVSFLAPKSVVLYANGGPVFSFRTGSAAAPNTVRFDAEQINVWNAAAAPYSSAGGFDDPPTAAFFKKDYAENVSAAVQTTSSAVLSVTNNIVAEDSGYPMNASTLNLLGARVLSMGTLRLTADEITDISTAISGETESFAAVKAAAAQTAQTAAADSSGAFLLALNEPLPIDTKAVVSANWNFLTKSVTQTVVGSVSLTRLRELEFYTFAAPYHRTIVKRIDPDWSLEVTDTRKSGGDWYLYASLPAPLNGDETLRDAIVFYQDQTKTILSDSPILIWQGKWAAPPAVTRISWAETEGLLLSVSPDFLYSAGHYSAEIRWEIRLTPPDARKEP